MTHAKHGPSSAARWLRCPDSLKAPSKGGAAADAGTLRHQVMEEWITGSMIAGWPLSGVRGDFSQDPQAWPDTKVCREYLEEHPVFLEAMDGTPGYHVFAERKVHWGPVFGQRDPEDYFGTVDVILSGPETFEVVDFKFGWVSVSAEKNFQLYLYQAGARADISLPYTPGAKLRHTIIQPNVGGVKIWEPTGEELRAMELEVRQGLALPESHRAAGDHCRYCGFRGDCTAQIAWAGSKTENLFKPVTDMTEQQTMDDLLGISPNPLEPDLNTSKPLVDFIERFTGADPNAISPQEAAELLDLAEVVVPLFSKIQEVWREKAIRGTHVPGWKLVPGRKSRKWADDEETILKRLANWKIKRGEATVTRLVTPAQAEKMFSARLGERQQRNMQKWITSEEGKPLLVREEDPRQPLEREEFEPVSEATPKPEATVKPEDLL